MDRTSSSGTFSINRTGDRIALNIPNSFYKGMSGSSESSKGGGGTNNTPIEFNSREEVSELRDTLDNWLNSEESKGYK